MVEIRIMNLSISVKKGCPKQHAYTFPVKKKKNVSPKLVSLKYGKIYAPNMEYFFQSYYAYLCYLRSKAVSRKIPHID